MERRFSPCCWRTKLALMHKGLPFDTIPWRFNEKNAIAFSGQDRVPVLRDGDQVVSDSWTIAIYLEDAYPDRPSLFRGDGSRAVTRFVNAWADAVLIGGILPDRETNVLAFRKILEPIRTVLAAQPYLGGKMAAYADYAVFGRFQWARCISSFPLLLEDDPISTWRDRLLSAFDGFAGNALGYPV
jgi:glutathione S-transferase